MEVSGYINGINNGDILTPVTVAVRSKNRVHIHMYVVQSASYLDINSDDSNICYVLRIIDQGLDGLRNGKFG